MQANVVRLFNTYGPGMRHDDGRHPGDGLRCPGWPALVIHGDGSQTRSFCYVSDLVALSMVIHDDPDGEIFNIGNPHEITVRELASTSLDLTETDSDLRFTSARPGDPERRRPVIDGSPHAMAGSRGSPFGTGLRRRSRPSAN